MLGFNYVFVVILHIDIEYNYEIIVLVPCKRFRINSVFPFRNR